jgi:hypothetical protein
MSNEVKHSVAAVVVNSQITYKKTKKMAAKPILENKIATQRRTHVYFAPLALESIQN